jgi:hypothetical protein
LFRAVREQTNEEAAQFMAECATRGGPPEHEPVD